MPSHRNTRGETYETPLFDTKDASIRSIARKLCYGSTARTLSSRTSPIIEYCSQGYYHSQGPDLRTMLIYGASVTGGASLFDGDPDHWKALELPDLEPDGPSLLTLE
jgi:hypothetical protein